MADAVYNSAKVDIAAGDIILDSDDLWIMLVDNTYTPDVDAHNFRDDVTSFEVSGTGYTAGGMDLGTVTVSQDNTNNRSLADAANPVWSTATITARGAIIYKKVGTAATDRLLMYLDFGSDVSSTAADFTVNLNASGFLALA